MPTAPAATGALRQQLLFLYLSHPSPAAATVAWSLFDGASDAAPSAPGEGAEPPYRDVLSAMRDGWRVIQVPVLSPPAPGAEHTTSFLPYEFVLERLREVADV